MLRDALNDPQAPAVQAALAASRQVQASRARSPRIHKAEVQARLKAVSAADSQRHSPFAQRIARQHARLKLPVFPTTTIGSFPQTASIRLARQAFKQGKLSNNDYTDAMRCEIRHAVQVQERLGLDVLVHGEAERNDMVEYFAEQLDGYLFTRFGWVQSYGSRCVKPAVIYGDLSRPQAMTVDWISYAQSLTDKVMKGMLTGPVTMLMWSFPARTCRVKYRRGNWRWPCAMRWWTWKGPGSRSCRSTRRRSARACRCAGRTGSRTWTGRWKLSA